MFKVLARLKLYEGPNKRQTEFLDGYRPMFEISEKNRVSGSIMLLNQDEFAPGSSAFVIITFIGEELNCFDFDIASNILFFEGEEPLGECEIYGQLVNEKKL